MKTSSSPYSENQQPWEETLNLVAHLFPDSKDINEKKYVPINIKRNIHSLVAITNEGSHWGVANSMVAEGKAPYLLRSLIYEMLNVLYWCKDVVNKEPTQYDHVDSMS